MVVHKEVRDHLVSISTFGRDNDFIPIHPAGAFIKRSQGFKSSEIVWFDRSRFDNQIGIPLTSGGIIPDRQILFSAISSDTIAAYLAVQLQASRLILLTGTKGVYRSMTDQVTVEKLNLIDDNYQIDGGMRDKIRRIKPAVLKNIRTYIASGELEFASEIILEGIINNSTEVICH